MSTALRVSPAVFVCVFWFIWGKYGLVCGLFWGLWAGFAEWLAR